MVKVTCETCGRTFEAKSLREAQVMLKKHCVHDIVGEGTFQRSRYGSDA